MRAVVAPLAAPTAPSVSHPFLVLAVAGLLTLCASGATVANAAPKPLGDGFQISACAGCEQERPVVGLGTGGGIVAWHRFNGRGFDLLARTLDAAAALPHVFDIRVHDGDAILGPLSTAPDGANWLTWVSLDDLPNQLFGQSYQGGFRNVEFSVRGDEDVPHLEPGGVAAVDDRNLLLAFEDLRDGEATRIWIWSIRIPSASQPSVLAETFGSARPRLCRRPNGSAVLAWQTGDGQDRLGLAWALVGSDGSVLRAPAPVVAPGGLATEAHHDLACSKDGSFVVTWQTTKPPARAAFDVVYRRFDKNAKPGAVTAIAKKFAGDQTDTAVTYDPTGAFIVAWKSTVDGSERILARRFSSAGGALGSDVLVEFGSSTSEVGPPDITAWGNAGRFLVVWAQDDVIRGRRFQP